MAANAGPDIVEDGIVFYYDTGNTVKSYIGQPSTNYWDAVQYSIYNQDASNYRNQTFPLPPIPGYEVVKVVTNTPGTYGHSILWRAPYPNNNVATITNSIYAWMESGTYVQVGQHWYPWYYGTQKNIPKGQWVRISETYTINEGSSYGVAALTYSTDGVAYFAMPQYEYTSYPSPFLPANGTRSVTQGLLDMTRNSTINLTDVSFNSTGQISFDGTNDYISIGASSQFNITNSVSIFAWVKLDNLSGWDGIFGTYNGGGFIHFQTYLGGLNCYVYGPNVGYDRVDAQSYLPANTWAEVGMTFGNNILTLYVNGIAMPTTVTGGSDPISSTSEASVGRVYDSGRYFGGNINTVRAYNRVLTSSEVLTNYNAFKTRFGI